MSVLLFDGFDLHAYVPPTSGFNLPGSNDCDIYWSDTVYGVFEYGAGEKFGQAANDYNHADRPMSTSGAQAMKLSSHETGYRVYVAAKNIDFDGTGGFSANHGLVYFTGMEVNGSDTSHSGLGLCYNAQTGALYLGYGDLESVSADPTVIQSLVYTVNEMSLDWVHIELFVDVTNEKIQLFWNGTDLHGPISIPGGLTVTPSLSIGLGADYDWGISFSYDHFVVTDGERLAKNKIYAVCPSAVWDTWTSTTGMMKGNLIINDASYQTAAYRALFSADDALFNKPNGGNAMYFPYFQNPYTLADWTSDDLGNLQGWGVCVVNMPETPSSDVQVRMSALGLSILSTNYSDGYPRINVIKPNTLTYYQTGWTKSDTTKTMAGNIGIIPRLASDDDANHLYCDRDGCILFAYNDSTDTPLYDLGITFAQEYRTDFKDWETIYPAGEDFSSYFIAGYSVLGQGDKKFQSNYVTVNYRVSDYDAGGYLQGLWDYSTSGDTGRWSSKQQIYRLTSNYTHQISKLKVRGTGKALQIKVTSESGKDFIVNGWTIFVTGNAAV